MAPLSLAHDSTGQLVLQTIDAYERSALECVARWSKRRHRRPPLLDNWLTRLPADARLLDLGCGGGQDAGDLQQWDIVSWGWIEQYLALSRPRSVSFVVAGRADLRQLPFQATSFDSLWAAASLIIFRPETRRVLTDLYRLIRPGGLFAATVTCRDEPSRDGWVGPGRYFARWRKDELARAVRQAG
jgi:SAM-dependent methyltransferase